MNPHRVRSALILCRTSVPQIARECGCSDKTLYAVLDGSRPGRDPKVRKAIAKMERIVREVACA